MAVAMLALALSGTQATFASAQGSESYSGLSDSAALAVAQQAHGETLFAPPFGALRLEDNWRVESYLGTFTARVAYDGDTGLTGLVESSVPLRAPGPDGELAPVDLELVERGGAFVPRVPLVPVEVDRDPRGGVSFTDSGFSFSPIGFGAAAPQAVAGKAAWANAGRDTDYFVTATPGGVETFAQLRSADSPESIAWRFDLPKGAVLKLAGRAAVIERGSETLARISPPIAWDADGEGVPASYELTGQVLRMNVAHRGAGVRHPVLADPEVVDSGLDTNAGGWQNSSTGGGPWEFNSVGAVQPGGDFTFQVGHYGQWAYTAPGSAYIYNAHFVNVGHDADGSQMVQGLQRPDGSWEAGYWNTNGGQPSGLEPMVQTTDSSGNSNQHCTNGVCVPGTGSSGNKAIFRGEITVAGYRPQHSFYQAFSATSLYLDDRDVPVVGAPSHSPAPGAWVDSAAYDVTAAISDGTTVLPGLGAKKARLVVPKIGGGTDETSATHACTGDHNNRCLQSWTPPALSYLTGSMPEGVNTLRLYGQDVLGKESAPQAWQVKVDRSKPQVQVTGDGWTAPAGVILPGDRSINVSATDAYSGVKSIEIKIDSERKFYEEQTCASGGCSMSRTYTYDTADYSAGEHTIEVIVEDQIGGAPDHQWSETETVTFGTSPPTGFTCSEAVMTIASGHIGGPGNYLGLKAEGEGDVTRVCWHLASGALANQAGSITFQGATVGDGGPAIEPGEGDECRLNGGATPVDNENPTLGDLRISYYVANGSSTVPGEAWVCVEAPAGVNFRLVLEVPEATQPEATVGVASPPLVPPAPKAWPAKASNACNATTGTFLVNAEVGGKHVWLANRASGTTADVCVRHQDVASGSGSGGIVTINPTNLLSQVGPGNYDLTICDVPVNHANSPVKLWIDRSSTSNPQSVCVDAGIARTRFFVGASGGGNPVTFTQDQ